MNIWLGLTYCCPVTPYGITGSWWKKQYLNQCLLLISEVLWHSPNLMIWYRVPKVSILCMSFTITNLRLQPHLPGVNERTLQHREKKCGKCLMLLFLLWKEISHQDESLRSIAQYKPIKLCKRLSLWSVISIMHVGILLRLRMISVFVKSSMQCYRDVNNPNVYHFRTILHSFKGTVNSTCQTIYDV